jgi:hypothetical protein
MLLRGTPAMIGIYFLYYKPRNISTPTDLAVQSSLCALVF